MESKPSIKIVDLGLLGNPPILSGYLLINDMGKAALVESGPTSVVDEYLDRALKHVKLEDLEYVFVTHVHLDHSGGAWKLIKENPNIKVIVHEKGARHLIDPRRLAEASKAALGKIYEFWGDPMPLPEKNVIPVGDQFYEKNFGLRVIYTPGHASHSTALYLEGSETLFSGDSAGMLMVGEGGVIWPAAPPPFYIDFFRESLKKLQGLKLKRICFPHYGCSGRPYAVLEEAANTYEYLSELLKTKCKEETGEAVFEEIMSDKRFSKLPRSDYFDLFYRIGLRGFEGSCV